MDNDANFYKQFGNLIKKSLLSIEEAISYAEQIKDPALRATARRTLIENLAKAQEINQKSSL